MRIAVIGSGNVGAALGRRWSEAGHDVVFGVRDPSAAKVTKLLERAPGALAAAPATATGDAEVVVLATPWAVSEDVVLGLGDLDGRILVDCTNPVQPDLKGLTVGHTVSAGEMIAGWAAGAKVVKAFNTTGSGNMEEPAYAEGATTMFLCGDDPQANRKVAGLAKDLGFEVVDAGGLHVARLLEPLAMLWINLAYAQGMGPDIAFRLMTR
ncbi:MAG: NADPH-dependent F420 reductase [Planctomycetota bacterium]|nr:NADPH-dependent F420 reductase [Planctomycetota bacterium]